MLSNLDSGVQISDLILNCCHFLNHQLYTLQKLSKYENIGFVPFVGSSTFQIGQIWLIISTNFDFEINISPQPFPQPSFSGKTISDQQTFGLSHCVEPLYFKGWLLCWQNPMF